MDGEKNIQNSTRHTSGTFGENSAGRVRDGYREPRPHRNGPFWAKNHMKTHITCFLARPGNCAPSEPKFPRTFGMPVWPSGIVGRVGPWENTLLPWKSVLFRHVFYGSAVPHNLSPDSLDSSNNCTWAVFRPWERMDLPCFLCFRNACCGTTLV